MKTIPWKFIIFSIIVTAGLAIFTAMIYPQLPDQIPVHWNAAGEADRFEDKSSGAFFSIYLCIGLTALFAVLPAISPKSKPIGPFMPTYEIISMGTIAFIGYMHIITTYAALEPIDITAAIILAILILFGFIGNYLGRVKPNHFVGIRTPWTLESPHVWERTHRLGGRLMVAAAILGVITFLLGVSPVAIIIVNAVIPVLLLPYSYIIYQQTTKAGSSS